MAGSASMKRIKREILDLSKDSAHMGDIVLAPSERSVYEWKASIPGPSESPYAGGLFNLSIHLPTDYPFSAPKVMFTTQIYHPNISPQGAICIDILKGAWSPALSLFKVMLSLSSLLTDPNPSDPLVPAIAQEYLKKRPAFDQKAREWTARYAMSHVPKSKQVSAAAAVPAVTSGSTSGTQLPNPASTGLLASLIGFATGRSQSTLPSPTTTPQVPTPVPNQPAHRTRSARQAANPAARPSRAAATEVIEIDDGAMDSTTAPVSQQRRKRKREEDQGSSAGQGNSSGPSRPNRRRNPPSRRGEPEVIVLDDD